MQICQVSCARPGGVNKDYACTGTDWAVVLDGATPVAGACTGCIHDVLWLVRQLAAALTVLRSAAPGRLIALLRDAQRCSPWAGHNQHDDATAVHLRPSET